MTYTQSWIQLEVWCKPSWVETLGYALVDAGSLGVQEQQTGADLPNLIAFFEAPMPENQQRAVESILAQFAPDKFVWSIHKDDGWSTRWQEYYKPIVVGERLVICPSWETYAPSERQRILWLDPGMAFGTGQHATTRGSLLLMEKYLLPNTRILDVGCGSGILALGALLCGAATATGIDIDPEAIRVALENAELNHLSSMAVFSTTPVEQVEGQFDMVLANIQAHILIPMVSQLVIRLQTQGILILSGILDTQRERVIETYQSHGCEPLDEFSEGEWFSLAFRYRSEP